MALALAMWVVAPVAQAQGSPGQAHGFCHATGNENNPFSLVIVQVGGESEAAHEGHEDDIDLGIGLTREEFKEKAAELCEGIGETSTTTTGTSTTTTGTGTGTTGTGNNTTVNVNTTANTTAT